mmetsp:Transcript_18597/g.51935  ORF Transcript_18597/g.51935 Transcript_18597/m.51935 type:complete len:359 (-) Transcript_18597:119-1195(-)
MGKGNKRKSGSKPKKSKKARSSQQYSDDEASDGDDMGAAAVNFAVDAELREAQVAKLAGDDPEDEAEEGAAEEAEPGPEGPADPYLLGDAKYIKKDTRWRNKQRTLVFASRGVTSRFRHLCEDIKKLLPHHKSEPKFDKKSNLHEINEVCELKSCNNVIFFEARKMEDLYMYVARVPSGPTLKFQVLNIHTTGEVRLAGNCLHGSRPLLYFDKNFGERSYLRLVKTMFTQAFGTPRNHPKSKPFHDHVMAFYWMDGKIWFRHYQISPDMPDNGDDPERQQLTEIGPRFVLDPIRILSGSFSGQTLYANAFYMSPTALRSQAKKLLRSPYINKLQTKADRKQRKIDGVMPEDPTDEAFI